MPPTYWSLAWRTKCWLRRLSGMTLPLSTAETGVESWILSLRGSPASPGAAQGPDEGPGTPGGCGPTSGESLARWDPPSYSWRTSQVSLQGDYLTFSGPWPRWGTMRSGVVSARPRSEPPICGSGGSYWPTPTAADSRRRSPTYSGGNRTLSGALADMERLRTPCVTDHRKTVRGKGTFRPQDKTGSLPDQIGGYPNPRFLEWMMGLPGGWTASEPVATRSFRRWLREHSLSYSRDWR